MYDIEEFERRSAVESQLALIRGLCTGIDAAYDTQTALVLLDDVAEAAVVLRDLIEGGELEAALEAHQANRDARCLDAARAIRALPSPIADIAPTIAGAK